MQIPITQRIIAILTILFINANTTISNEIYQIDNNTTKIIDDNTIKTDNIYIDSDVNKKIKDGLVMNENISNNVEPQIKEGTITTKSGFFSVIKENPPALQVQTQNTRIITPKPVEVITNAHRAKMSAESKELVNNDLVINYAAIDSDMNIEPIKTNGKVILMVTPEVSNQTKQYNMLKVDPEKVKTEPESNGISLTASGKKYNKDKELTEEIQIHNLNGASISIERLDRLPVEPIDKRQYMRFKIAEIASPVIMSSNNESFKLLDISRGGVAIQHNNNELQVGNIVPVHLKYKDVDINTNIEIVSTKDSRVSAKFINNNKTTEDKLLYLSVLLESDNNMLKTRLSR